MNSGSLCALATALLACAPTRRPICSVDCPQAMLLTRVYLRFFRSFNFDYERKASRKAQRREWEQIDGAAFPFITVDLDPEVTGVIGANESGKSHLIAAIEQVLDGGRTGRQDFCRYSSLYSVEVGDRRSPDLGVGFEIVDKKDRDAVAAAIGMRIGERAALIRMGDGRNLLIGPDDVAHEIAAEDVVAILARLPRPFRLQTDVPLPDSIGFDELLDRDRRPWAERKRRSQIDDLLQEVEQPSGDLVQRLTALLAEQDSHSVAAQRSAMLARRLLRGVARVDASALEDLESALRAGKEGEAAGIVEQINRAVARHLNFNRWWRQDKDFQLRVSPRIHDLAFTIRDRTGTEYSFAERSTGLRYFLSYFVQLKAHHSDDDRSDLLLLDEPDAYLSSTGQQDLLRRLENFARPDDGSRAGQVVYVTHSPFLINRNATHRLRVLDKGSDEEGTRVVRDAAQNRYEPLRSSLGAFVAETAFIGGANLIVEGPADQVLLTGASALLRHRGVAESRLLDLNDVTIVPAGGASSVPYIAYLARGRDEIKPACVALLDDDPAGHTAARQLSRALDGTRGRVLADRYVLHVSDGAADGAAYRLPEGLVARETEDLLPVEVVIAAARSYVRRLLGGSEDDAQKLTTASLRRRLTEPDESRMWDAISAELGKHFDAELAKVGFAKEVVAYLESHADEPRRPDGLPAFEHNFGLLLSELADRLRAASLEEASRRAQRRSEQLVRAFLEDHPAGAMRDEVDRLLRDIAASLEDSAGDDAVRHELDRLRKEFRLRVEPLAPVAAFDDLRQRLDALKVMRREAYRIV